MTEHQKAIIIDSIKRTFTSNVPGSENLTRCMISDEQAETLFGAINLAIGWGPYTGISGEHQPQEEG